MLAVLQDRREVAAELAPCPTDPTRCTLRLWELAPARTQAAIAAKLGPQAAARQARMRQQVQGAEMEAVVRTTLLSSQRAVLLAASLPAGPLPHPLLALARVLREGLRSAAARQQRLEAAGSQQRHPVPTARAEATAGVLAQHKQLKKAWLKRRWV